MSEIQRWPVSSPHSNAESTSMPPRHDGIICILALPFPRVTDMHDKSISLHVNSMMISTTVPGHNLTHLHEPGYRENWGYHVEAWNMQDSLTQESLQFGRQKDLEIIRMVGTLLNCQP